MEEIFKQRKVELEIAAKNTIVEIYMIKMQADAIAKTLEAKEKLLDGIDVSIKELDHLGTLVKIEEKEATKAMETAAEEAATAVKMKEKESEKKEEPKK